MWVYPGDDVMVVSGGVAAAEGIVGKGDVAGGEEESHEHHLPLAGEGQEHVHHQQQVHHVAELPGRGG